jgi:hypothetical protein
MVRNQPIMQTSEGAILGTSEGAILGTSQGANNAINEGDTTAIVSVPEGASDPSPYYLSTLYMDLPHHLQMLNQSN